MGSIFVLLYIYSAKSILEKTNSSCPMEVKFGNESHQTKNLKIFFLKIHFCVSKKNLDASKLLEFL